MTGLEIGLAVALVAGIAGAAYAYRPSASVEEPVMEEDDVLRTS